MKRDCARVWRSNVSRHRLEFNGRKDWPCAHARIRSLGSLRRELRRQAVDPPPCTMFLISTTLLATQLMVTGVHAFFNLDASKCQNSLRPSLHCTFSVEFDSDCMKAMCIADSGCVQKGCARDVFGRMGCGFFRMNIWQFKVR